MDNSVLSLFQLCDTNFPTGAFSHSFGLETYVQNGTVHDPETFAVWLDRYLNGQLVYADGIAASLVYDALENNDYEEIWKFDRMLTVQNFARETREGTRRMGERLLTICESLHDVHALERYRERIDNKQSFGHPAIVFAMIGHFLGTSKETTISYYLYSTITDLIQNAVRAIPIGQTAGQKVTHQFQQKLRKAAKKILTLDEDDFGIISPGIELAQMQHERVTVRVFSS